MSWYLLLPLPLQAGLVGGASSGWFVRLEQVFVDLRAMWTSSAILLLFLLLVFAVLLLEVFRRWKASRLRTVPRRALGALFPYDAWVYSVHAVVSSHAHAHAHHDT